MLGHFNRITPTATALEEPLYGNLFEVTFTFPDILKLSPKDHDIMMIAAKKISLDTTTKIATTKQKFKYSDRLFVKTPDSTAIENLTIDYNINVSDQFSMRTWNYLRKWYDLAWNSQTGELHYKRAMVGTIVAHIHDREGIVLRRVEYRNVQLLGLSSMDFSWESNDILSGTATFCADYWIDQYFDITASNK
jgi:hypothetical protein